MPVWNDAETSTPKQWCCASPVFSLFFALVLIHSSNCILAVGQQEKSTPYPSNPSIDSGEIRTLPADTPGQVRTGNARNRAAAGQKYRKEEDSCFLPPLNLTGDPVIPVGQLQISTRARKEYQAACAALRDNKTPEAEKHLRKVVQESPKYAAAWVTLGQVLAAQQGNAEARDACTQASTADSSYVRAYLCLADIAARAHDWKEVLAQSTHALDLDPEDNAVAYEYNAAANLNLRDLAAAEKSGLRAAEIDQEHREPRVYFVLAQIYELKGDPQNEAVQLRTYLKYATNPDDVAMARSYLAELEKTQGK